MEVGLIVYKKRGMDEGKSGLVLEIFNKDQVGYEILSVLVDGEVRKWPAHLTDLKIERINCEQDKAYEKR